jgi:hypothetical protein
MINNTHIYFLHKGDHIPFYVGKTINLIDRLKNHKQNYNYHIDIESIEVVNDNEWKFWEEFYISLFKSWGFLLTNKTDKGRGCGARPCLWSDKISDANKGKQRQWRDPNELEIRKQRQTGKQYTLGYKYTPEQKNKLIIGKRKIFEQYNKNGEFIKRWEATKTEIANFFNKDIGSLTQHIKGKQSTAYGYIWRQLS